MFRSHSSYLHTPPQQNCHINLKHCCFLANMSVVLVKRGVEHVTKELSFTSALSRTKLILTEQRPAPFTLQNGALWNISSASSTVLTDHLLIIYRCAHLNRGCSAFAAHIQPARSHLTNIRHHLCPHYLAPTTTNNRRIDVASVSTAATVTACRPSQAPGRVTWRP